MRNVAAEGSTNGRSRAREGVREAGPAVEQEQGLAMGASSGVPAGERERGTGGREVEDWRMFFFLVSFICCRRGLHGCMVAPSAQPDVLNQVRRRRSSLGHGGGQLRGWW